MSLPFSATPFARIANDLVVRVANALGSPINADTGLPEFVRPVASDRYKVTETENLFAYLVFFGPSPVDPSTGYLLQDYGAGRHTRVVARRCRLYLYTRSGVDVYGGDEVALLGEFPTKSVESSDAGPPGQWLAEEFILNALDNYQPVANGRPLTVSPVHWIDSANGPAERKPEEDEGLVRSFLDFSVVYCLAITNVEPAPTTLPTPTGVVDE